VSEQELDLIEFATREMTETGTGTPKVDVPLRPRGDRDRADVSALPDQIRDDPVLFALLNGLET